MPEREILTYFLDEQQVVQSYSIHRVFSTSYIAYTHNVLIAKGDCCTSMPERARSHVSPRKVHAEIRFKPVHDAMTGTSAYRSRLPLFLDGQDGVSDSTTA